MLEDSSAVDNVITRRMSKSQSDLGWDLLLDGRYPVMSWKCNSSAVKYIAFSIYFLWTFELIVIFFSYLYGGGRPQFDTASVHWWKKEGVHIASTA